MDSEKMTSIQFLSMYQNNPKKETANERKATEIAKSNGINYKNHSKYEDDMDSTLECYKSALEAMQWKDEQHAKEKQQWIEKAESVCAEMFLRIESELFNVGVKNTNNRKEIEDTLEIGYKYFKQAMKGK